MEEEGGGPVNILQRRRTDLCTHREAFDTKEALVQEGKLVELKTMAPRNGCP